MKKERKVIEPNATIVFDRSVYASELQNLPPNFEGNIIINGVLEFDREITIKCDNLYAKVVVSDEPTVHIEGNLYTEDDICVYNIEVNGSVYCGNNFMATDIIVAEDCITKGRHDKYCSSIEIGGTFICEKTIEYTTYIRVLGKFKGTINSRMTEICIGS